MNTKLKPTLHTPAGPQELLSWWDFETMDQKFKVWSGTIFVTHQQFDPALHLGSLRVVAYELPAAWWHNGSFRTMEGTYRLMAHYWPLAITYKNRTHLGIPLHIFHDRVIYPKPSE